MEGCRSSLTRAQTEEEAEAEHRGSQAAAKLGWEDGPGGLCHCVSFQLRSFWLLMAMQK
jgi:hypothetical protein